MNDLDDVLKASHKEVKAQITYGSWSILILIGALALFDVNPAWIAVWVFVVAFGTITSILSQISAMLTVFGRRFEQIHPS